MQNDYILHAGVKGMRWGVRRWQNPDGTLTEAGKKRYGGMSTKSEKSSSSGPSLTKRATRAAKRKIKKTFTKENAAKAVAKGAEVTSKMLLASAADDVFYGGAGKRIAKETIKQTGRAAVTAYTMARGGYDIRWYDN